LSYLSKEDREQAIKKKKIGNEKDNLDSKAEYNKLVVSIGQSFLPKNDL